MIKTTQNCVFVFKRKSFSRHLATISCSFLKNPSNCLETNVTSSGKIPPQMAAKNIYSFRSFRRRSFFCQRSIPQIASWSRFSNIFLFSVDEIPEENKTDFRLYSNEKMLKKWPKAAHEIPVKIWFIFRTIVRPKFFTWSVFKLRNPMNWILSRINITMMGWLSEQFPSECLWCGGDRNRDWLKIYVNAIEPSDGDTNSYNGNDDARQSWPDVRRGETLDLTPGSSIHHFVDNFRRNTSTPWKTEAKASTKSAKRNDECSISWDCLCMCFYL